MKILLKWKTAGKEKGKVEPEVDLGYRFMSQYWGKGYATEANAASLELGFKTLHLKKIIAMVMPLNTASIRVLEKLGFKYEKDLLEEDQEVRWYTLYK